MPPRHSYWTILIDDQPTAFRAHDPEELLPTLNRLREKNASAVMKWFERGQLFDSRDAARDAGLGEGERRWEGPRPKRDDKWRPGGEHRDPRQKYKDAKKAKWTRFKEAIRERHDQRQARDPESVTPPHGDPLGDQARETPASTRPARPAGPAIERDQPPPARDFRNDRESRPPRDFRNDRESRPPRDFRNDRESRPPRDFRNDRESRPPRDFRNDRESRPPQDRPGDADARRDYPRGDRERPADDQRGDRDGGTPRPRGPRAPREGGHDTRRFDRPETRPGDRGAPPFRPHGDKFRDNRPKPPWRDRNTDDRAPRGRDGRFESRPPSRPDWKDRPPRRDDRSDWRPKDTGDRPRGGGRFDDGRESRPARKPFGAKPAGAPRGSGPRFGDKKPFAKKPFAKKPFGSKPFGSKPFGSKPPGPRRRREDDE